MNTFARISLFFPYPFYNKFLPKKNSPLPRKILQILQILRSKMFCIRETDYPLEDKLPIIISPVPIFFITDKIFLPPRLSTHARISIPRCPRF